MRRSELWSDGVHPTPLGYRVMGDLIYEAFVPFLVDEERKKKDEEARGDEGGQGYEFEADEFAETEGRGRDAGADAEIYARTQARMNEKLEASRVALMRLQMEREGKKGATGLHMFYRAP